MMRFRDLSPEVEECKVATTQHPVMMVGTGDWRLSFFCPSCGRPHSVSIFIGESRRETPRRWQASPMPDGSADWFDRVTITPSINYTACGHGPRKSTCRFHGNISNGEVNTTSGSCG